MHHWPFMTPNTTFESGCRKARDYLIRTLVRMINRIIQWWHKKLEEHRASTMFERGVIVRVNDVGILQRI